MNLGFLFTNKCNARCDHCSTSCGPDKSDRLALKDILRLMRDAAQISDGQETQFCISGGEPFLFYDDVLAMVKYGAAQGAKVTCVTNAFWARDRARAFDKLKPLSDAGLTGIGISTSDYHMSFVPLERVITAVSVAKQLNVKVVLKFSHTRTGLQPRKLRELFGEILNGVDVETPPVSPSTREGYSLPTDELILKANLPTGVCPNAVVTIRENADVYTCCTPGAFIEPLRLGNVNEQELTELKDRFDSGGLQRILFTYGPAYFVDAIKARGLGHLLRSNYQDVCHLCTQILSQPPLLKVVDELVEKFEIELMTRVFEQLIEISSNHEAAAQHSAP